MPEDILVDNLNAIADSIELIINRFSKVNRADDFVMNSD
jgi:hypothetical protein